MRKLLHIVGNRPQFIKLAVLHEEIADNGGPEQAIIHTGQHFSYQMNELFFKELSIPSPDVNFNIRHPSPNQFIAQAADALQDYFSKEKNAMALVYGDTNTTLAAAIAAKRTGTPLLHFEAGVRTGDMSMPEEINRLLTDRLADINYCCTQKNYNTLLNEGYGKSIASQPLLTGDLMLDAFIKIAPGHAYPGLPSGFVLCTIHRAANLGNREHLQNIIDGLNQLHRQIPVVMPVHPHTEKKLDEFGLTAHFVCLPPVGYPEMKRLLNDAAFVITDSGGTSREAYFSRKASLIIMEKPFWPEIIEAGCALQTDASTHSILENVQQLNYLQSHFNNSIFGDGNAARSIRENIQSLDI
ncbi:MAG: UDP-N-acetyl glucosamine 2-epimerase [Ferruginibacter sp.]